MTGSAKLAIGVAASLLLAWVYHGPLGAADRLTSHIEADVRSELVRNEMDMVQARLERGPLTRTLVLSGPADDFQRSELIRLLAAVPGVSRVRWAPDSLPLEPVTP